MTDAHSTRRRRFRPAWVLVVLCLASWGFFAVSTRVGVRPSAPTRAEFAGRLQQRHRIDQGVADCITTAAYSAYNAEALRELYTSGIRGLPLPLWDQYGHGTAACLYQPQLDSQAADDGGG